MPVERSVRRFAVRWNICVACFLAFVSAARAQDLTTQPSGNDIASLVQRLGDGSFSARSDATRRLCALGPAARPALGEAARSSDAEIALRAKALLKVLDDLLLGGCRIELAVSKSRIAWNESVDLRVTVRNESEFDSTLPFESVQKLRERFSPLAAQVCLLLDLSDFLQVTGPDGGELELHVDALTVDPAVEAGVRERAESPPLDRLEPSGGAEWVAQEFNRGWARYPLLRSGRYMIRLVYAPQWDDEEFVKAGVGAVRSNAVEVTVTDGAPAGVEGPNVPAKLVLAREDGALTARVENPSDVPVWVNANFAPGGPPFASLRWVTWAKEEWRDAPTGERTVPAAEFRRDRLFEVAPGAGREIGRAEVAALWAAPGARKGEPLFVRAMYTSFVDGAWQRTQESTPAKGLDVPLPQRMIATTLVAEPVKIE